MTGVGLEQAVSLIEEHTPTIDRTVRIPLEQALHRRLAEDIRSPMAVPPFHRSPLDGYALRSDDVANADPAAPATLSIVGEVCAGAYFSAPVRAGQAVRIMTGAMLPAGCDCVVRQEDVSVQEKTLEVSRPMRRHANFVFEGEDIQKGQLLAVAGEPLSYAHVAVLASVGYDSVPVRDHPRVGLFCTGDELVPPGSPLEKGKIYNSNQFLLGMRLEDLQIPVTLLPPVADDPENAARQIDRTIEELDVLLTTGGVSVGKKDIMHDVFRLLGVRRLFWRVLMKPGTPALCGIYKGKLLLCLSGNPFAAITTLELLGRPLFARLTGQEHLLPIRKKAVLRTPFSKPSGGRRFIRARMGADGVYLPGGHSSGQIYSLLDCNCLVDIPAGSPPLEPGENVNVVLL